MSGTIIISYFILFLNSSFLTHVYVKRRGCCRSIKICSSPFRMLV